MQGLAAVPELGITVEIPQTLVIYTMVLFSLRILPYSLTELIICSYITW